MDAARALRVASVAGGREPDYNTHKLGDLLGGVLESGARAQNVEVGPGPGPAVKRRRLRRKLSPTNSERMNRALAELGPSAFKIHMLLWQWRGAPARGKLPFFTIHSLHKFCSLSRPTVRSALAELVGGGWIEKYGYNKHHKNELFRLVPIRDVSAPAN